MAGVVWDLEGRRLALAATDRFWLAHHTLRVAEPGPRVNAFTDCEATRAAGDAVAHRPLVEVHLGAAAVILSSPDGSPIAELTGTQRAVPDLGLLISRQPARRAVAGFHRQSLLDLLASLEPEGPTTLLVDDDQAQIGPTGSQLTGSVLTGWASATALGKLEALVRPSLLAAAVRACVGDEILVGMASADDPLAVTSPDQPGMTSLVMPMHS